MRDIIFNQNAEADSPSEPFFYHIYKNEGPVPFVLELRPNRGKWGPVILAVPHDEYEETRWMVPIAARLADAGRVPVFNSFGSMAFRASDDNKYMTVFLDETANQDKSIYVYFKALPSKVVFGQKDGPLYELKLLDL